jgi:hypothetical protein
MAEPKARHPEVVRITALLETLLRTRRVRIIEVERQLGLSNGTLRRILDGKIALKYQLIVELLEVLAVSPAEFFRIAYDQRPAQLADDLSAEMLRKASRLNPSLAEPHPSPLVDDLAQVFEDALRRILPANLLTSPPAASTAHRPRTRRRARSAG